MRFCATKSSDKVSVNIDHDYCTLYSLQNFYILSNNKKIFFSKKNICMNYIIILLSSNIFYLIMILSYTFEVKVDVHVLSKSGGVIIPVGLSITKGLQDIIGLEKYILNLHNLTLLGYISNLSTKRFDLKWRIFVEYG